MKTYRGSIKIDVRNKWDKYEEKKWKTIEVISKNDRVTLEKYTVEKY